MPTVASADISPQVAFVTGSAPPQPRASRLGLLRTSLMRMLRALAALAGHVSLGGTPHFAAAVRVRSACVRVTNNSPEALAQLHVLHRYSSDHSTLARWSQLAPGATTGSDELKVNYKTGLLTTGVDWWALVWSSPDGGAVYITDPNNFRWLLEHYPPSYSRAAIGVSAACGADGGRAGGFAATTSGLDIALNAVNLLLHRRSTIGYKRHILTDEDASDESGVCVEIEVTTARAVVFRPISGQSSTVTSRFDRGACSSAQ